MQAKIDGNKVFYTTYDQEQGWQGLPIPFIEEYDAYINTVRDWFVSLH